MLVLKFLKLLFKLHKISISSTRFSEWIIDFLFPCTHPRGKLIRIVPSESRICLLRSNIRVKLACLFNRMDSFVYLIAIPDPYRVKLHAHQVSRTICRLDKYWPCRYTNIVPHSNYIDNEITSAMTSHGRSIMTSHQSARRYNEFANTKNRNQACSREYVNQNCRRVSIARISAVFSVNYRGVLFSLRRVIVRRRTGALW